MREEKEQLHLILQNKMANYCTEDRCAHYIASDKFHVYRHKFLWTISIATIFAGACFSFISLSFKHAHESIVATHEGSIKKMQELLEPVRMSKDSCYYADEYLVKSIESYMSTSKELLELQSTKIQSDYAILSLWAGILMIVFLVFSIYSMFKTDEILRQSREGLKAIEATEKEAGTIVDRVETKTNEEIAKVSNKAAEESTRIQQDASNTIDEVKKEILEMRAAFSKDVNDKSQAFQEKYDDMMRKLEETTANNTSLIQQLVNTIKDSTVEQKGDTQRKSPKPRQQR